MAEFSRGKAHVPGTVAGGGALRADRAGLALTLGEPRHDQRRCGGRGRRVGAMPALAGLAVSGGGANGGRRWVIRVESEFCVVGAGVHGVADLMPGVAVSTPGSCAADQSASWTPSASSAALQPVVGWPGDAATTRHRLHRVRAGWPAHRSHRRPSGHVDRTGGVLGLLTMLLAGAGTSYWLLIAPLLAVGFGTAYTMPAATAATIEAAPSGQAGMASGHSTPARRSAPRSVWPCSAP